MHALDAQLLQFVNCIWCNFGLAGENDMMQAELNNFLSLYREKRKIEISKTPEIYINQYSSASEVQEWLKAKGFSQPVCSQLSGMDGDKLFALKRDQLEQFCGREEGRRLDSQITISRNTSGV